jgi:hypothetical protein
MANVIVDAHVNGWKLMRCRLSTPNTEVQAAAEMLSYDSGWRGWMCADCGL